MKTAKCRDCGATFTLPATRGRPPVRCESCRLTRLEGQPSPLTSKVANKATTKAIPRARKLPKVMEPKTDASEPEPVSATQPMPKATRQRGKCNQCGEILTASDGHFHSKMVEEGRKGYAIDVCCACKGGTNKCSGKSANFLADPLQKSRSLPIL